MEDRAHIFYTGDKDQTRWQLTAILENLSVPLKRASTSIQQMLTLFNAFSIVRTDFMDINPKLHSLVM